MASNSPAQVLEFNPAGSLVNTIPISGGSVPFGLAFDAFGNLYVADRGAFTIFKVTPAGVVTTFASSSEVTSPSYLAFGPVFTTQTRYFSNLSFGDSYIDLTNDGSATTTDSTGANTQNICVNVYAFDANEEMVSCCTCPITPNGLKSLSVKNDLVSNTLTPGVPLAVTVELVATTPVLNLTTKGTALTGGCDATIDPVGASSGGTETFPVSASHAWGSTPHLNTANGQYNLTETEFSHASLGLTETQNLASTCGFINSVGSGFGICKSCQVRGLGAAQQ